MKRVLVALAVACLVLLAGCATDNGVGADDGPDGDDGSDGIGGSPTEITDVEPSTQTNTVNLDDDGGPSPGPGDTLEIHHIDVGQADSTLVITPEGATILIDTGDRQPAGDRVIDYLESHGIDRIDHLIATHGHADHIGGHAAVIEWAETEGDGIGAAYDSGAPQPSQAYENYLDAIEDYDIERVTVEEHDELPLADEAVRAGVINPPRYDVDGPHPNSVAMLIEYGSFQYVTTGDAEGPTEQRIVDEWAEELDADVYQAGDHGSSSSSSAVFLDALEPEVAVISSAYESESGHPHDEVLETFAERGIETYWTGVHGHVVVTTDGRETAIETEREFSTDPAELLEEKPAEDSLEAVWPGPIRVAAATINVG